MNTHESNEKKYFIDEREELWDIYKNNPDEELEITFEREEDGTPITNDDGSPLSVILSPQEFFNVLQAMERDNISTLSELIKKAVKKTFKTEAKEYSSDKDEEK